MVASVLHPRDEKLFCNFTALSCTLQKNCMQELPLIKFRGSPGQTIKSRIFPFFLLNKPVA
jgi:hypothetical protein